MQCLAFVGSRHAKGGAAGRPGAGPERGAPTPRHTAAATQISAGAVVVARFGRSGGRGCDQRERDEIAPDRVLNETERLERDGAEQGRVAGLGEDHRRGALLSRVEEEERVAASRVGESEALAAVRG